MNKLIYVILFVSVIMVSVWAMARDDSQQDVRENPQMQMGDTTSLRDNTYPKFINKKANHIDLNGDDWSDLAIKFTYCDSLPVNILHIGDSHLQCDVATDIVRQELVALYGRSHGRGLVVPFKLAGTNQPYDYSITSRSTFAKATLLKTPWPITMGFTGVALRPSISLFDFSIQSPEVFNYITVFFTGRAPVVNAVMTEKGPAAYMVSNSTDTSITIEVVELVKSVDLTLGLTDSNTSIHGFNLVRGNSGISYHVIGNNGATYTHYNMIKDFCACTSQLSPDLIIISLGTNEAFGRVVTSEITSQIDALVKNLRHHNPEAKFLLVTPAECQRRQRSRRRRRRSSSYVVNEKVTQVRKIIADYARAHNIALYDWYAVAGGAGASTQWLNNKYLNTDRIHLTMAGYKLQGNIFADALINTLILSESTTEE